jgi:hypothetical protein
MLRNGHRTLAAVVTALYLAARETRLARKRELAEMNELIDFASAVLEPLSDPAKEAADVQVEIDHACEGRDLDQIQMAELGILPALRARRETALTSWHKRSLFQKRVFANFTRHVLTRHVKLATILATTSELFDSIGESASLEDVRRINAIANSLKLELRSLRGPRSTLFLRHRTKMTPDSKAPSSPAELKMP